MRWRELLDAYADWMDRLVGPLTEDPPYEECPDTCPWRTPFQPITSPSGSQAWKRRMLDARREALANRIDQGVAGALADATETIPNPYAQETTMTTPDPAAVALADAAPDNAFRTEDGGVLVRLAAGWLRIKDGYHRVLPLDAVVPGFGIGRNTVPLAPEVYTPKWETYVVDAARAVAAGGLPRSIDTAGPDPSTPPRRVVIMREDEVGSVAWLRDLADRLQQYGELIDMADPEEFTTTPRAIRSNADKTERQTARDTRDRERVEPILAARWAKDRDRQFLPSLVPTWADLTDEERAHCIDYGLELYRAGRDDTVAAWQPGNGGGGGNPGPRGGQPQGGGAAHA